jgi:hypothetical protein
VLLHELVHGFVQLYVCRECVGYRELVDDVAGHGFVWQRIACWVEYAAPKTMGVKVSLGRMVSLWVNWGGIEVLADE